jgi:hypothetical protein
LEEEDAGGTEDFVYRWRDAVSVRTLKGEGNMWRVRTGSERVVSGEGSDVGQVREEGYDDSVMQGDRSL